MKKMHIVAITALIKNSTKDKFLVLKRSQSELAFPGKWSFPGGKAERGESVLDTLRREVKEESGLDIEDSKRFLKDFNFIRPDDRNVIGFCFEVVATHNNVAVGHGFDEYRWVTPDELASMDHIEGMLEEVTLAFRK
jgi:mutator protein MutT